MDDVGAVFGDGVEVVAGGGEKFAESRELSSGGGGESDAAFAHTGEDVPEGVGDVAVAV